MNNGALLAIRLTVNLDPDVYSFTSAYAGARRQTDRVERDRRKTDGAHCKVGNTPTIKDKREIVPSRQIIAQAL